VKERKSMGNIELLKGECIITIPQINLEQMFLDYREHVREVNKKMRREEEEVEYND
jgi:hypothetical protein